MYSTGVGIVRLSDKKYMGQGAYGNTTWETDVADAYPFSSVHIAAEVIQDLKGNGEYAIVLQAGRILNACLHPQDKIRLVQCDYGELRVCSHCLNDWFRPTGHEASEFNMPPGSR